VDRGEGALLLDLEGVVPGEGERVDMGAVGGDGEAGLDDGQRAGVGEERVAALLEGGRVREGGLLHRGAQVAHEAEVVVGRGGLALRVGGGDVEAQRAVEVRGGRLLLVGGELGGRVVCLAQEFSGGVLPSPRRGRGECCDSCGRCEAGLARGCTTGALVESVI
jgi:hypothetical protein